MKNQTSPAFVVINRWTSKIVAQASHYQEAAKVVDDHNEAWKREFNGPFQQTIRLPFTLCQTEQVKRFYPKAD